MLGEGPLPFWEEGPGHYGRKPRLLGEKFFSCGKIVLRSGELTPNQLARVAAY